jgi:hypothetical protein
VLERVSGKKGKTHEANNVAMRAIAMPANPNKISQIVGA